MRMPVLEADTDCIIWIHVKSLNKSAFNGQSN